MTRTSRFIWTASFSQFEDLPGPPFHLNEPGYAAFLFDPKCSHAVRLPVFSLKFSIDSFDFSPIRGAQDGC